MSKGRDDMPDYKKMYFTLFRAAKEGHKDIDCRPAEVRGDVPGRAGIKHNGGSPARREKPPTALKNHTKEYPRGLR